MAPSAERRSRKEAVPPAEQVGKALGISSSGLARDQAFAADLLVQMTLFAYPVLQTELFSEGHPFSVVPKESVFTKSARATWLCLMKHRAPTFAKEEFRAMVEDAKKEERTKIHPGIHKPPQLSWEDFLFVGLLSYEAPSLLGQRARRVRVL